MNHTEKYLATDHLAENMGHHAVRGGVAVFLGQSLKFLVQTISTVVLARLLVPADFGLLAMILGVSAFLIPFKDLGLSTATLQRPDLTHGQLSNLFWINATLGVTLAMTFAIAARLISRFYGQPILTASICVFSTKFFLEALAIQHQALLRRQMQFSVLSFLEVVAITLASTAAIGAAWTGMGHWALVIQQIVLPLVMVLGVWLICPWRPALPARKSGVMALVTFGGQLTVSHILYEFARGLDNILIGWRWGSTALGLYNRAGALVLLPLSQITWPLHSVAIASLSRLQNDPERYRRFYCRLVTLLAFATTPLIVGLAVLSHDIVLVVLGKQWMGASTIFAVLAIAALGQPLASTTGLIYASLGQGDRQLRWSLIATPLTMAAFFVGLPWGPLGVATAYAIVSQAIRIPGFFYAFKYAPVKAKDFVQAVWRPIALSGWMFVCMLGARDYLSSQGSIERLAICSFVGAVAFVTGVVAWPETRRETIGLMRHVMDLWHQPWKAAVKS